VQHEVTPKASPDLYILLHAYFGGVTRGRIMVANYSYCLDF